ncbi:hypothetical protein JMJ77_0006854, partial [Colletotrichum scovillei]
MRQKHCTSKNDQAVLTYWMPGIPLIPNTPH